MNAAPLTELLNLFAWPLPASRYAELVNPLWSRKAESARVERVWDETHDARTLTLRPGRGWRRHHAGQHVAVSVPSGGRYLTRTYSISSAPERRDGLITITVKAVPGGRVSQELVRRLRPGSHVRLGQPEGDFVLPPAPVRPLFVTAGSGITPVMSMLRSLAARDALTDVVHLHFAPHRRESIFGSELARLADLYPGYRLSLVETRESADTSRHLEAGLLARSCPDWREREAYACGPRGLLEEAEDLWKTAGLEDRLHIERFVARRAEPPADATGGRVSFARSRAGADADGQASLLRVAEDAGLSPAHGCRMGICHSCDVALLSGCVRDLRTNLVTKEPGTPISLCVSAAAGAVEIDL